MSKVNQSKPPSDRPHEAKDRKCLKCRKTFKSAWAGERICRLCKSGFSWRQGGSGPVTTGHKVFRRGHGTET